MKIQQAQPLQSFWVRLGLHNGGRALRLGSLGGRALRLEQARGPSATARAG